MRVAGRAAAAVLVLWACGKGPAPSPEETPAAVSAPAPAAGTTAALVDSPPAATDFALLEREWMDALARRDAATLERLLAEEFFITGVGSTAADPVGRREEWLANAARYPWPPHEIADVRVARLGEAGDVAVVKFVLAGDYPPQSLSRAGGRLVFLVTDVWVWRDGRWQVAARHSSFPAPEEEPPPPSAVEPPGGG